MSTRRSSIKGAASLRRLFKALPDASRQELLGFLNNAGPPLATKMRSLIPVLATPRPNRTPGEARASISWKVTPTTLNLKVGELSKKDIVFYAHILDVGRKGQNVRVTRGSKSYPNGINVRARAPLYIIRSMRASFKFDALPGYQSLMNDILLRAAQGAGDD